MGLPWGVLTILFGLVYGAVRRGKQDKGRLFRDGLLIGVVLAMVLVAIGALSKQPALGITIGVFVGLDIIVAAIVLSLLFIVGVWLGDLITGAKGPPR